MNTQEQPECPHCDSAAANREPLRPDSQGGWLCNCCGRVFIRDDADGRIVAERRRPDLAAGLNLIDDL